MKKLSIIEENVFDDMLSRSKSDDIRKEDEINNLDFPGFLEYLNANYKTPHMEIPHYPACINIPLIKVGTTTYNLYIDYKNDDMKIRNIEISSIFFKLYPKMMKIMKEKFMMYEDKTYDGIVNFTGLAGKGDVRTNRVIVDILDTIIDNIPEAITKKRT